MTAFGFFGGDLLSIRAGAWIRAPTRGWRLFGGRVDTRPYKAVVLRARGYAPLQGAAAAWGQAALRIGLLLPVAYWAPLKTI